MRALAFLHKTFLENLREWKILSMVLVFAPFFVYLMWGYFHATEPAYQLIVIDHDAGVSSGEAFFGSGELIDSWRQAEHSDGDAIFEVSTSEDIAGSVEALKTRKADLVVEIPQDFSLRVTTFARGEGTSPAVLTNHAEASNARGTMAMAMSDYVAFTAVATATQAPSPLDVRLEQVGGGEQPSEFDLYVPALLMLAIIMVMFTAAATLIKEVDKRTISRLVLSRLTTLELLAAVSVNQVLIGVVALALAYGSALTVGYRSEGSLLAVLVVGALATLAVVAISVLVAAFMRTIFELLTVGCFPFFILMFFSDCMFPLPKITVGAIGGFTLYATDVLPTAMAVRAFNRILNHGAGLGDVWVELLCIAVLTVGYFAVGTWLFTRRHFRVF